MLRKGSRGPQVKALQEALKKKGFMLTVDGSFGDATDVAVREFQRRRRLSPDGVAGPRTIAAVMSASALPAQAHRLPTLDPIQALQQLLARFLVAPTPHLIQPPQRLPAHASPVSGLAISEDGLGFIYRHEAWAGVSNHLHWPRGASGVTLGPGYDMKERSAGIIATDLQAIGVDAASAQAAGKAAGLVGDEARKFAQDNRALINLTAAQETKLLRYIVPQYESIVRNALTITLQQHEYDALVSFAYNPGGRFDTVARHLNGHRIEPAMNEIRRAVTSNGEVLPGLVMRRDDETALFQRGIYRTEKPGSKR